MDNTVLYGLSYGMYVVGADDGGRPVGCIINTCIQITSDNPMLAISLNKNNYTLAAIKKSGRFSLSIISEDTDPAIITAFGFQCSRDRDKYADFGYQTVSEVPVVNGTFAGRLICKVIDRIDCETHEVVLARLVDTVAGDPVRPMTYGYYHQVIKGKAPRNAPTYRPEEETPALDTTTQSSVQYVCPVCGYVYQGEIGDEPEGYVCPVCGFPGSEFERRV